MKSRKTRKRKLAKPRMPTLVSKKKNPLTGPYGVKRLFNGETRSLHQGVDFRARMGERVLAAAVSVVEQLVEWMPGMGRLEWLSMTGLVAELVVERVQRGGFKVPWFGVAWALDSLTIATHQVGKQRRS